MLLCEESMPAYLICGCVCRNFWLQCSTFCV